MDYIRMARSVSVGYLTYCGGFPEETSQTAQKINFQMTSGYLSMIPEAHQYVVSNITDSGCSGGPCVGRTSNDLIGIIQGDFGRHHHQTCVIPFLDADNFLRRHGYGMISK
jgi:hypothetical protein